MCVGLDLQVLQNCLRLLVRYVLQPQLIVPAVCRFYVHLFSFFRLRNVSLPWTHHRDERWLANGDMLQVCENRKPASL